MKLLHAADLHQGLITHSRPGPGGIPNAMLSVARCWAAIVDAALEDEAELVIIAGDTFHEPNPGATALTLFDRELRRLRPKPVVIIAGNHDRAPHPDAPCVLELFHDPANGVHVMTRPDVIDTGAAIVAGLPSVTRHHLAAAQDKLITDADMGQALATILEGLAAHSPDILVAHWSVEGSVLGSEVDIALAREPIIPRPAIIEGPWRYAALGHLHRAQMFHDGPAAYAGSADRISFAEENDAKLALRVELDHHVDVSPEETRELFGIAVTRHVLPARRFVTLTWDEAAQDYTGSEDGVAGAIVRIRGFPPDLARAMRTACLRIGADVVYVQPARARRKPLRVDIPSTLAPIDALEHWLEAKATPEPERAELRSTAAELAEEGARDG